MQEAADSTNTLGWRREVRTRGQGICRPHDFQKTKQRYLLFMWNSMYRAINIFPQQLQYHPLEPVQAPPSRFIGRYQIDYSRMVGQGNFSTVYMAIDSKHPEAPLVAKVVNKWKLKQENLLGLVHNQIEILLSICHDSVINCRQILQDETWCYFITQFCEGGNLETRIKTFGVLSEADALGIIKDTLEGLVYLESKNIIHRDIKAANIFMRQGRAVIADFGFAKFVNQPFNDISIGSLPYMPPEAVKDKIYHMKTDVWTYGVFVYELLHGQSPYARSHNVPELINNLYTPLNPSNFRTDISKSVKQLILFCLEIDVDKRPTFKDIKKQPFYKNLFIKKSDRLNSVRTTKKSFGGKVKDRATEGMTKFKEILLEIQQIRDCYKLAVILKPRTNRMEKVRDRMLVRVMREIQNIEKKVGMNLIDYGTENRTSRQKKLSNVVAEYKEQFQNQVQRRGITVEKTPSFLIVKSRLERTLEQDLNIIEEEQLRYVSQDHDKYTYSVDYRQRIKEILDDLNSLKREKQLSREA